MTTLHDMFDPYEFNLQQLRWMMGATRLAATVPVPVPLALAALDYAQPYVDRAADLRQQFDEPRAAHVDKAEAAAVKHAIEGQIAALHGVLAAHKAAGTSSTWGRSAALLLEKAFPRGLGDRSNAGYRETLVHVDDLVAIFRTETYQDAVAGMAIGGFVEALERLNAQFRPMVAPDPTVTAAEVDEALTQAREAFLFAMVRIAGAFEPFGGDTRTRDALTLPWRDESAKVAAEYRARGLKAARTRAAEASTSTEATKAEAKPATEATSTEAKPATEAEPTTEAKAAPTPTSPAPRPVAEMAEAK